jgi:hypothetical protein
MHVQSMHCVGVGGATFAGTRYLVPRLTRGDAVTMREVPWYRYLVLRYVPGTWYQHLVLPDLATRY